MTTQQPQLFSLTFSSVSVSVGSMRCTCRREGGCGGPDEILPILGLCAGLTLGIVLYPPFVLPVPDLTLAVPEFLALGVGLRGQVFPPFSAGFSFSASGADGGMTGEGDLI